MGESVAEKQAVLMHHVGFRRQGRAILDDVDLEVGQGQKWVLFGPNGVGKSTLVAMMSTRGFPAAAVWTSWATGWAR